MVQCFEKRIRPKTLRPSITDMDVDGLTEVSEYATLRVDVGIGGALLGRRGLVDIIPVRGVAKRSDIFGNRERSRGYIDRNNDIQ